MVAHPKSMSTQPTPKPDKSPCTKFLTVIMMRFQAQQFSQEGEERSVGGPGGGGLPPPARIPEQLGPVLPQRDLLQLRAESYAGKQI